MYNAWLSLLAAVEYKLSKAGSKVTLARRGMNTNGSLDLLWQTCPGSYT